MPKPNANQDFDDLPQRLRDLLVHLPEYIDDKRAARIVSENCFEVSNRTIEIWPLPTRTINGRSQHPTVAVLREAWRRINAAPEVMRIRRRDVVGIGRGRRRVKADRPQNPEGEMHNVTA